MSVPKITSAKPNPKGNPPSLNTNQTGSTMGNNTTKPEAGELVAINLKVSPELRVDLKTFAAIHSMSMTDVLKEGFELLKKTKGGR
jgi:hypothetical protein